MTELPWWYMPLSLQEKLRKIQDEYQCFKVDVTRLEEVLESEFGFTIKVTCVNDGSFYNNYTFVMSDQNYTLLRIKYP